MGARGGGSVALNPGLGQPEPLLGQLHQPILDVGVLRDVERGLARLCQSADVGSVLKMNYSSD